MRFPMMSRSTWLFWARAKVVPALRQVSTTWVTVVWACSTPPRVTSKDYLPRFSGTHYH